MKHGIAILLCSLGPWAQAQVHLSGDLEVTGDPTERRVDGLAAPIGISAAVTVEAAVLGGAHWAAAVLNADTLMLSLIPAETELREGVLIRFKAPATLNRRLFVRHDQLAPLPLLRSDSLPLVPGQVPANTVVEIILAGDHYVLAGSATSTCPGSALALNERVCMDINEVGGFNIYQAAAHCAGRGGRLCTWDEYFAGCTLLGTSLNGRFDNWEWIDDSSNHTHTGDQAGRTSCYSHRSAQPLLPVATRCCYHPR